MQDTPSLLETEISGEAGEPPSAFIGHPETKEEEQCDAEEPPSLSALVPQEETGDLIPEPARLVIHYTRFISSPRTRSFRKKHFPSATAAEWNDWKWQLRNRITDAASLSGIVRLSEDEYHALNARNGAMPLSITPYYASLLEYDNPAQPLRRSVVPVTAELFKSHGESEDPLGEESDSPVHGLVHRYPDRALFLVTDFCSTYCRYCTRSRMVGRSAGESCTRRQWEKALAYIEAVPQIRDVLLSGGDPLTLPDDELEWLLIRLRRIPHVEIVRIGTKVPMVLPQRITSNLTRMLKRYHPLWMNIHCTHPDELTTEAVEACARLSDAGIPLGSQTVLLAGINDSVETLRALYHGLLRARVRHYYLYQCDPIVGSSHFRTTVEKGIDMIRGLRGHTTGFAVPTYVIDAPGGGGKIPLLPEYLAGREGDDILLRNYENLMYRYPDTAEAGIHGTENR